jgi:hypothetical protein
MLGSGQFVLTLEAIKSYNAIIFDLRQRPQGGEWILKVCACSVSYVRCCLDDALRLGLLTE